MAFINAKQKSSWVKISTYTNEKIFCGYVAGIIFLKNKFLFIKNLKPFFYA